MPPIFSFEKREEIHVTLLEIGIRMIKEKGIKRMTIDDVAEQAGIGKGTFYHFFKSKEWFVHDVIQFSKEKIYDTINKAIAERGGIDKETFLHLLRTFSFTGENNIISFMSMEDEEWLRKKLPGEYSLNPEKEEKTADLIFKQMIGARSSLNYHVIANMIKIMAMASENKAELHQDALEENLSLMTDMLCNYIYES